MTNRQTETKITALYERLSNDDRLLGDSNSIVNQKAMLENYAKQNGFSNVRHYTDELAIIRTSGENPVKSRVSALVLFHFFEKGKHNSFKSQNIIMEGCAEYAKNNRSMQQKRRCCKNHLSRKFSCCISQRKEKCIGA